MIFRRPILFTLILILPFVFGGCKSKLQKALSSPDGKKKLEMAEYYYKKKDYYRAQLLYEQLEDLYSGTAMAERIMYYSAQCNFGMKNYTLASFQFKTYYETYPTGMFAEECLYLNAYCNYMESQSYELDQTDTYKALETLRIFISVYPESKFVPECNTLMDKLRAKLAYKAYRNARLYFDIGAYKSAIVSLKNVAREYPEISQREEVDFLVVKSAFLLAENSVPEKQLERFRETIEAYNQFADNYPESSKYMMEARLLKLQAEKAIQHLENNKS